MDERISEHSTKRQIVNSRGNSTEVQRVIQLIDLVMVKKQKQFKELKLWSPLVIKVM